MMIQREVYLLVFRISLNFQDQSSIIKVVYARFSFGILGLFKGSSLDIL